MVTYTRISSKFVQYSCEANEIYSARDRTRDRPDKNIMPPLQYRLQRHNIHLWVNNMFKSFTLRTKCGADNRLYSVVWHVFPWDLDAKIDFIVDLGLFGTNLSKNVGVQIFGFLNPPPGAPFRYRDPSGWIRVYLCKYWVDFNDLKVILGVFHDAESIYDTFKAITGSFNSLPVKNTNFWCRGTPNSRLLSI